MTTTLTKDELLARTRTARADWEVAFAAVPRDQLTAPGAAGEWSAKDAQSHLTADHRWVTGQLRAGQRGELPTAEECYGHNQVPPPGTDLADQDQRNAWRHAIDRERPRDEVLDSAPRWADALEEAIAALPDEELARPYTFGDYLHIAHLRPARDGEPGWPLGNLIASYADEHYATHTADLRASARERSASSTA
jgi:hypothetical protein